MSDKFEFQQLVDLCKQTHQEMQRRASRSVDAYLVARNWLFGWYIVEYEQKGADRAEYGAQLIKRLSEELGKQLGKGFSSRALEQCRKFYMTRKKISQTVSAEFKDGMTPIPRTASALSWGKSIQATDRQAVLTQMLKMFPLGWSHYVTLLTIENPDERRFYEIEAAQNN